MKQSSQSGLSTFTIIVTLAVLAVILGLISSLSGGDDAVAVTAENDMSGLEAIAQNMAENKAKSAVNAATERAELIDETITTDIEAQTVSEAPVAAIPTTTLPPDQTTVEESEPEPVEPAPAAGTFTDYDQSLLAEGATNVLFFHADWCPSCRGLENDLNANLSQIPANVNILKLDYDTETELKSEYGVVRQHTLVVVDGNGNEIKKLTGLINTLDQVVSQL